MTGEPIARLKVTLDDVEPAVLRRIEVPHEIRLDRLHHVLQVAVGWTDSHLYEFQLGRTSRWGVPDPDWLEGRDDAEKAQLAAVLAGGRAKTLKYLYDFGDGWTHTIKVERVCDAEPGLEYPRLVEARGGCPPEDVGGPFGYADFLEVVADAEHPRHDGLLEWAGGAFDPAFVDVGSIERGLGQLADYWNKAPSRRRKPTRRKST